MIGKIINNYKIISEIGHGGMGVIYKAYDIKLERYVAIKILRSQVVNNSRSIERFRIEAKNHAKLSHPNIVPVYGFIDEPGILGIVMELIEGETVEQKIEREIKIGLSDAINIIKQVLCGVGYAHSKGYVHRDIKPSNIIIGNDNVAKIMDFGISKSIFEKGITGTGTNIGTLYYMSPEQIRGEEPTVHSDIYSIGVTLYEMLAGVVPFNYDSEFKVIEGHLKESPPELLNQSPELPIGIQNIIEKAINKKQQNRYCSHKEFLDDLTDLEVQINKFHKPRPVEKDRKSKRYKLKALFFTILVLAGGFGLFYFAFDQVNQLWKSGINPFIVSIRSQEEKPSRKPLASSLKWNIINSGTKNKLNSIIFINDSTGFCCGADGTLLSTNDFGKSWSKSIFPSKKELLSLCFTSSGNGFIIDENSVYKTDDLGKNWRQIIINSFNKKFIKIRFINNSTGYICGSNGLLMKTVNGGEKWFEVETGTSDLIYDIAFADQQKGFAVGWNGLLLKTLDAGENWTKVPEVTSNYLRRIKFISQSEGFIVGGNGEILHTTDGGSKWEKIKNEFSLGLYDFDFIDETIALIVGGQGKILMSTDRGKNWTITDTNVFTLLNEISLTPRKKIFAVGVNGTIVKL